MLLWSLCVFCLGCGLRTALLGNPFLRSLLEGRHAERELRRAIHLFHELSETLESGSLPEPSRWAAVGLLPPPWGALALESLKELRARGAAVLPTLKRLRGLAENHRENLREGRARAAQALSQALVCALLVPAFGSMIYLLLPGLEERPLSWAAACGVAFLGTLAGAAWLLALAEKARWGGLSSEERPWVLAALCAGERFLALVRSGTPADLAWLRAGESLGREAPGLAAAWGHSFWSPETARRDGIRSREGTARFALLEAGGALRRAVQVSLMEGRPCAERIEITLASLQADLRAASERELSLLGTRALKPLFVCVAPSVLSLLGVGLWLGLSGQIGEGW